MRLLLLGLATALLSSGCSDDGPTTPSGSGGGVTVFRLADFQGDSTTFVNDVPNLDAVTGPCGEVVLSGFTQRGSWVLCPASFRVSPGWQATIYSGLDYRGVAATFTASVSNLRNIGGPCNGSWHECIASLRVSRR